MINNNYASCINTVLKDVCFLILSVVCTLYNLVHRQHIDMYNYIHSFIQNFFRSAVISFTTEAGELVEFQVEMHTYIMNSICIYSRYTLSKYISNEIKHVFHVCSAVFQYLENVCILKFWQIKWMNNINLIKLNSYLL